VDRYDAYQHTRELYSENLWLRDMVTAAAQQLERLASTGQGDRQALLRRAQRLRRRLHDGPPEVQSSFYPGA
jgi:hypothetical protein